MNTYKYVRVQVKYVGGKVDPHVYETVVEEHASQGWQLVQIFIENPAASATEHVIIFTRPVSE